ncbi:MAG: antibiotic biosynthesis monooxygenase [Pseudomonadota bacterium]
MRLFALKTAVLALTFISTLGMAEAGETTNGEVAVFLSVKTIEGQRDTVVKLWDAHLKTRAQDNPEHVSYVVALDANDPNTIHISEVYATSAAFEANSQSPWFGAYMAEVGPLLDGEPAFARALPYWVK